MTDTPTNAPSPVAAPSEPVVASRRPAPLVVATFVLALIASLGIYSKSEQLLIADNRLAFYALIAAPGVGLAALVAMLQRGAAGRNTMRWYAGVLATVGLVAMAFLTIHAWGVLTGGAPWCAGNTRCSDGIGSPFLHLSWLDWMAIATYVAGLGAAASA